MLHLFSGRVDLNFGTLLDLNMLAWAINMALSLLLKSMSPWLAQAKGATESQKRDGQYEGREVLEVDNSVWRTIDWEGRVFHTCASNNPPLNHSYQMIS